MMSMMLLVLAMWLPGADGPPAEEQAREILTAAAVAQRGQRAQQRPNSLHGLFSVTARKQDGSGTVSIEVERFYQRSPERMLTQRMVSLSGSDSTVGFDGRVFWMQDNHTGQVLIYSDDPETFHTDLELEQEQLELTRLILDLVSVDGLLEQLHEPRVVGRELLNVPSRRRQGEDREVDVVRARLVDVIFPPDPDSPPPLLGEPPPLLEIQLFIDSTTHYVHRIDLSTINRVERRAWRLLLSRHGPNAAGLIVPRTLRVLDGRGDLVATLGLIADDSGLPVFELGQDLDPRLFAVPRQSSDDGDN